MKQLITFTIVIASMSVVGFRASTRPAPQCPPLGTFVLKKTVINGVDKHGTQQIVAPVTNCLSARWYRIHVEKGKIIIQKGRESAAAGIEAGASYDTPSGNFDLTLEQVGEDEAKGSYEVIPTPAP